MLDLRNQDHSTHDQPSLTLHLLFNPFFRSFCSNKMPTHCNRLLREGMQSHYPDSTQDIHPRTTQGAGGGGLKAVGVGTPGNLLRVQHTMVLSLHMCHSQTYKARVNCFENLHYHPHGRFQYGPNVNFTRASCSTRTPYSPPHNNDTTNRADFTAGCYYNQHDNPTHSQQNCVHALGTHTHTYPHDKKKNVQTPQNYLALY